MSLLDKAIAAVTPPVSPEKRAEARAQARAAAQPGDWLSQILDHHEGIEAAFAAVKAAGDIDARRAAQKKLGVLLTGHSIAEEAVIYPALAHAGKTMHATMAYTQQAAAKMQMAALEHLDPLSEDYLDKLGHLEGAVATHVYEEESDWFLDLKQNAPAPDQQAATQRYAEEYGRYIGEDDHGEHRDGGTFVADEPRSFASPDALI
jgi:hypothetical protein